MTEEIQQQVVKQEGKKPEVPQEKSAVRPRDARPPREREKREDGVVFVGKKSPREYANAVMHQFASRNDVTLKSRGNAISAACDVSQMVKNNYIHDLVIGPITLVTEELEREDGRWGKVTAISIPLNKRRDENGAATA